MHGTNNMLLMVLDVQCTLTQPGCMKNAVSGEGGIHQWDWTKKLTPTVSTLLGGGVFMFLGSSVQYTIGM